MKKPFNIDLARGFTLPKEDIEKIHEKSLEILETVGIQSRSEKILGVFKDIGAEIDSKNKSVRIPSHLIEEALNKAPKEMILSGRDPSNAINLKCGNVYFASGATPQPSILDVRTDKFRRPTKKDMIEGVRLCDALTNMDYLMSIGGAYDVPLESEFLHEWEALLNYTTKPIVYAAPSASLTQRVLDMGVAVMGSESALKSAPLFAFYVEPASPLQLTVQNEGALNAADVSIPLVMGPMPMLGASAPVTPAGAAVIANAENLAILTLVQLSHAHAPFVYGGFIGPLDPRTGACCYGAPETITGTVLLANLAHYYNLPSFGYCGSTEAKVPDLQAGVESALTLLVTAACGITLIHDLGTLDSCLVGSMEEAVIDDEIVGMIKHILSGPEISEDTLAIDTIKKVGPGGNFMAQKHTLNHFREIYLPTIFTRDNLGKWLKSGKELRSVAKETVLKILKEHRVEELPNSVQGEIQKIIKDYESKMINQK